jgi:hypothetical protein
MLILRLTERRSRRKSRQRITPVRPHARVLLYSKTLISLSGGDLRTDPLFSFEAKPLLAFASSAVFIYDTISGLQQI